MYKVLITSAFLKVARSLPRFVVLYTSETVSLSLISRLSKSSVNRFSKFKENIPAIKI